MKERDEDRQKTVIESKDLNTDKLQPLETVRADVN